MPMARPVEQRSKRGYLLWDARELSRQNTSDSDICFMLHSLGRLRSLLPEAADGQFANLFLQN